MSRDLTTLSKSELKSFLDSFDDVLCDGDGVIYTADTAISGVNHTILKLKELGKKVHFITNNSAFGVEGFQKKLQSCEVAAEVDDIVCPSLAIISFLKKIDFSKKIYALGFAGFRTELSDAGFEVIESDEPSKQEETYRGITNILQDDEDIGAIAFDYDINLTYVKILKAELFLKRPDVLLIIGTCDAKVPVTQTSTVIAMAAFQNILEEASGRPALRFGKPSLLLHQYMVERFHIKDPSRAVFVGDSLESDMLFASKSGYQKLLVLSGSTELGDVNECSDENKIPDYYINSFGDLHELIKHKLNI